MPILYHICTEQEWNNCSTNENYKHITLETEGFIHHSNREQLSKTLDRFFGDATQLKILEILYDQNDPLLKFEMADNELFGHYYGEIPKTKIKKVIQIQRSSTRENFPLEL